MSSGFSIVNYSTMHVAYRRSIHLQALLVSIATVSDQVTHHSVVDLVVSQRDVVLESSVPCCQLSVHGQSSADIPFLELDFLRRSTGLSRDQAFQIAHSISWQTFNAD